MNELRTLQGHAQSALRGGYGPGTAALPAKAVEGITPKRNGVVFEATSTVLPTPEPCPIPRFLKAEMGVSVAPGRGGSGPRRGRDPPSS